MKFIKILCGVLASLVIAVSASAAIIYENGSLNGTYLAQSISPPQTVSNSFTISSATQVTGVTLGLWTLRGTLPATLDYSFGTSAFAADLPGGSTLLTNVFAFNNGQFDVYLSSFAVNLTVGAGEYWLTLGNGRNNANAEIFWDTNFDGLSRAQYRNDVDAGPLENSQYFQLTGGAATDPGPGPNPQPVPEPGSLMLSAAGMIGVAASRRRRTAAA
ncbi:PEP-CTERM sorting domain-containing protein [Massilia sp. TWR1-2-2]|uniref:PEP-CTERM sorting domain-containing protein n=1 Tax=Massilia sp. TWR1-2-2 TaxID=2804584 RepID=UPI003CF8730E